MLDDEVENLLLIKDNLGCSSQNLAPLDHAAELQGSKDHRKLMGFQGLCLNKVRPQQARGLGLQLKSLPALSALQVLHDGGIHPPWPHHGRQKSVLQEVVQGRCQTWHGHELSSNKSEAEVDLGFPHKRHRNGTKTRPLRDQGLEDKPHRPLEQDLTQLHRKRDRALGQPHRHHYVGVGRGPRHLEVQNDLLFVCVVHFCSREPRGDGTHGEGLEDNRTEQIWLLLLQELLQPLLDRPAYRRAEARPPVLRHVVQPHAPVVVRKLDPSGQLTDKSPQRRLVQLPHLRHVKQLLPRPVPYLSPAVSPEVPEDDDNRRAHLGYFQVTLLHAPWNDEGCHR
mmetsp:Transcript_9671/g.27569  ORF Transcript_9671/g.27569 Transcript_9671/m.27569 type:complete len:338 (+) Transcript_9671:1827-2840(+)